VTLWQETSEDERWWLTPTLKLNGELRYPVGRRKVSAAVTDRDNTAARQRLTGRKRRVVASDR
jgi:hypothetical protein